MKGEWAEASYSAAEPPHFRMERTFLLDWAVSAEKKPLVSGPGDSKSGCRGPNGEWQPGEAQLLACRYGRLTPVSSTAPFPQLRVRSVSLESLRCMFSWDPPGRVSLGKGSSRAEHRGRGGPGVQRSPQVVD